MLESQYSYTGVQGTCSYNSNTNTGVGSISSFVDIAGNSTTALQSALVNGPVSVAIEADTTLFQSYSSGVITDSGCGVNIDHAVLAVGYGTDPTYGGYFLVKNSWSSSWGESGYVRIGSDQSTSPAGVCGILSYPS